jgi:O-antigen/teichoic acid export membrane protein
MALSLLKESYPMILSGFFAIIYLNIDQVMIEEMLNNYQLGQYSAAVRISTLWYFLPMAIGWSVQTAIVNGKKAGKKVYYQRLQTLFTLTALVAYSIIIPITIFSDKIVNLLYGNDYNMAGGVLSIHILSSLFLFVGSVRGLWVTNESYFKFDFLSNMVAGMLNIILNLVLIRKMGIVGAAWATLISYSITYVWSGLFFKPARKIVMMQLRSIFLLDIISQLERLRKYNE